MSAKNSEQDVTELMQLVTDTTQQIKDGQPLVMVVSVVDMRNNGSLASIMIKGPPPPPLAFAQMIKGQPGGPSGVA